MICMYVCYMLFNKYSILNTVLIGHFYRATSDVTAACVCLSVCLFVTRRHCIETTGRIELAFGTHPTVCYKEIRVPPKIRVLPSGTLS